VHVSNLTCWHQYPGPKGEGKATLHSCVGWNAGDEEVVLVRSWEGGGEEAEAGMGDLIGQFFPAGSYVM